MSDSKYEGKTGVRAVGGVTYPRSVTADVEKKTVDVIHVTTCKDGKAYVRTRFDFNGVDDADILECAAKHLVIACRSAEYRTRTVDEAIKVDGITLDPMDYIKRERASADPKTRAMNALKKLSSEEIAEIMKAIGK
jgi:copper chaperone CopZ